MPISPPVRHTVNIRVPGAVALEVLQFPSPPNPPGLPVFLAGGPFVGPVAGSQITVRTKRFLPLPPFIADRPSSLIVHAWYPPAPGVGGAPPPVVFAIFPVMVSSSKTVVLRRGQLPVPGNDVLNDFRAMGKALANAFQLTPEVQELHTHGSEHARTTGAKNRRPVASKGTPRRRARYQVARARRAQRKAKATVSRYARGRKARYQGAYGQAPNPSALDAGARAASAHLFGPGAQYSGAYGLSQVGGKAYGQGEVPPNTVPGMSDTIFCKRYPLTCANMQALEHSSYGSQTARDITDIEFDEVEVNGGTDNGGWFTDEVVDRPGRTAAIAAVAGLGIWGFMSMRDPRY